MISDTSLKPWNGCLKQQKKIKRIYAGADIAQLALEMTENKK